MAAAASQEIWVPAIRPPCHSMRDALRRRWRWIVICGLAGLSVSAWLGGRTEPQYAARAKLRLLGEHSLTLASDTRSAAEEAAGIRSQYFVLRSSRILSAAAEQLNLPKRWNTDLDGAVRQLAGMVEPRRVLDANVTELKVTSTDPRLATDIANAIVEVYTQRANQPRLEQAQLTLDRLRTQGEAQANLLHEAEQRVLALRQEMGMNVGEGQMAASSLNPLRQSLVQAEAGLIEAQIKLDSLQHSSRDALTALQAAGSNDMVSRELASKLIEREVKLGELERKYGASHPAVMSARVDFDQTFTAAATQVQRLVEMAQTDRAAADVRATQARQRLSDAEGTLVAAGGSYGQLLAATQQEDTLRSLCKLLSERAQKLEIEMSATGPSAEVIELAAVPSMPELGTPLQVALATLCIGLAMGMVVAVGMDRLDSSIRGPEEVEWQLNVPMLGVLGKAKSLLAWSNSASNNVERFRMLRNSIDFADHTLRTLCIASADTAEGCSACVANLAWAWAEHGARVLVIDANLRAPVQHQLMNLGNEQGLMDHLRDQRSLDELVIQTSNDRISLLPAGRISKKKTGTPPAITPQQLNELLLWARSRADVVLFDTSPLLMSSDSAMIARQVDATILVARQQWTSARNLRRAVHLLATSGEGLLGVVLTGASASASWDPMPIDESVVEVSETSSRRTAVSRQRKRSRHAA